MLMTFECEPISNGDVVLKSLDAGRLELDDFATLRANQMIVMRFQVGDLVTRKSVPEVVLRSNAAFNEKLERAVDCGISHLGIFAPDLAEQVLD